MTLREHLTLQHSLMCKFRISVCAGVIIFTILTAGLCPRLEAQLVTPATPSGCHHRAPGSAPKCCTISHHQQQLPTSVYVCSPLLVLPDRLDAGAAPITPVVASLELAVLQASPPGPSALRI